MRSRARARPTVVIAGLLAGIALAAGVVLAVTGDRDTKPSPAPRPTAATGPGPSPAARLPPALRGLPAGPADVWAVGDGADGSAASTALAMRITAARPDLFLYLGDVYEQGTPAEFGDRYDTVYGALSPRTAPTPGNHDWGQNAVGYAPYWRRALGGPLPGWYAVRIAGWTLLSLSSEAPHAPGSAQVAWLRAQLKAPGTCRLAFWHRPRFSAGSHGDNPDVAPLWDALEGHATLVVGGHDHNAQRLRPVGGLTQLVAGAGGHIPYPFAARDGRLAFAVTGRPVALRLHLAPGRADLAFVRDDGRTLDRRTVRCATGV